MSYYVAALMESNPCVLDELRLISRAIMGEYAIEVMATAKLVFERGEETVELRQFELPSL